MTVVRLSSRVYTGLAADTKPSVDVPIGARFYEYDSGETYVWDGAWRERVPLVVDEDHQHVHEGITYHSNYSTPDATPIADNASLDMWVSVPADLTPNVVWGFFSGGMAQTYIYEAPTVSGEGTLVTPINRRRDSSNTAGMVTRHTPTVSDVGTPLHDGDWQGSGRSGQDKSRATQELILKPRTTYLWRLTARANNIAATIELDWYEPT